MTSAGSPSRVVKVVNCPPCQRVKPLPAVPIHSAPCLSSKSVRTRPAAQPLPQTEGHKAHPIKPDHPVIAPDPEIAVARLRQRLHRVLRQPLLPLPRPERQRQPPPPTLPAAAPPGAALPAETKSLKDVAIAMSLKVQPPPPPPWRRWICVERSVGIEGGRQALRLAGLGRPRRQVRVQPHRHPVVSARAHIPP